MVSSGLPPAIDGIGDHAACMAEELVARGHTVTCLVPKQMDFTPIKGVTITPAWDLHRSSSVVDAIAAAAAGIEANVISARLPFDGDAASCLEIRLVEVCVSRVISTA